MKKFFTLVAATMVGISAFADTTYHQPGAKYAGTPFEYVNLSNALVSGQETTSGATGKYGISPEYPWISYNYSASTLVNGGGEVARGGIWVSSNPIWMTGEFAYMVDDAAKWLGSPKFEVGYTKGETYLNKLCPKSMTFNVTATTRIDILLTGGGSNTNDADVIVKKADGTVVKTIYVGPMAGKSNKAAAANTNSKWAIVDGLDAAESYQITVAPSVKNAQVQVELFNDLEESEKIWKPIAEVLGDDVNFGQDIELAAEKAVCNIKAGAIYVAALHIFGTDLTVNGKKPIAPISDTYYSPVGNKLAGAGFAYINMSNTLQNGVDTLTTYDASGNASHAGKYSINNNYPWITYNYTASVLDGKFNAKTYKIDGGKCEVSRGGYYSSINPVTGAEEFVYMVDDANTWLGSPKAEVGYTKGETYLAVLNPKTVTYNIKDAKKVEILLTGAGSNSNDADVIVKKADGTLVKTVYVDPMAGKSNKASAANTKSKWAVVDGLDVAESYQITVAPSIQTAQLQVEVTDELEQVEKVYKPIAEVLGDVNFGQDIELDPAKVVCNVKTGSVAVLALRVYGEDDAEDKSIEGAIAYAKANNQNTIKLHKAIEYTLTSSADADGMTINGGGAKIVTTEGQLVSKGKGVVVDNVVIDATANTVAPIAMAAKETLNAADTTALYSYTVEKVPAVLYTEEEAAAYNAEYADEIEEGTKTAIAAGDVKTAATTIETAKYENASNKVFEAQLIAIRNSEIKTATSFITGGNAPWALRKLEVDNSIIETTANSGKAFLNWEEGASQIKDIVIKNSTLYGTETGTTQRFHRYSAQVDPWRVWGYATGTDKNAAGQNTWTLENNTIVNLCGNKEFANNIKNTAATTFTFKGNVFANTWRLQKLGSNITRNFVADDNAICGGVNTVDATDASKWATEDKEMAIYVNAEAKNFVPAAYSFTGLKKYGDPRYLADVKSDNSLEGVIAHAKEIGEKNVNLFKTIEYTLTSAADADGMTINGNGAKIVATEGQVVAKGNGIVIDNVVIDATANTVAPIAMASKDALNAADTTAFATWTVEVIPAVLYTAEEAEALNQAKRAEVDKYNNDHADEILDGEMEPMAYPAAINEGDVKIAATTKDVYKYENASNKVLEAQLIAIRNSEIKTASSFITGGNAPWALRKLEVDNSIIETSAKDGKAFLNWEDGASQIKDIVIKNSTLYADSVNTIQRFHRYSAQVDPWRVWGYATGTDKNAAGQNTWTLENNTIVNLCGNKEFANNIKNTAATTYTFKKNVFANTWRLQKLGSNVTRNFEASENVICGGVNTVDATDATKWATEETAEYLGVYANETGVNFVPTINSIATRDQMGDPRWLTERPADSYVDPNPSTAIQSIAAPAVANNGSAKAIVNGKLVIIKNGKQYNVAGQSVK